MNITDIKTMNTVERLQAMEALWDSLLHEDGEIESPAWHEEILNERKTKIAEGKAGYLSLADLKTEFFQGG